MEWNPETDLALVHIDDKVSQGFFVRPPSPAASLLLLKPWPVGYHALRPDPRQRFRINVSIHSDASPVAKIDLDQSVPGRR